MEKPARNEEHGTASWGATPPAGSRPSAAPRPTGAPTRHPPASALRASADRRPLRGHVTAWRAATRLTSRGAARPLSSLRFAPVATSTPQGEGLPSPRRSAAAPPTQRSAGREGRRRGRSGSDWQHRGGRIRKRQDRAKRHPCGAASAARRGFQGVAGRMVAGRGWRALCGFLEAHRGFPLLAVFHHPAVEPGRVAVGEVWSGGRAARGRRFLAVHPLSPGCPHGAAQRHRPRPSAASRTS